MISKVFKYILISFILVSLCGAPAASQPLKYWIDPSNNLWLNLSMNGSTQYFNIYHTPGYAPDGNSVMWAYDNFSSKSLDTNKWTPYKVGSNNAIVTVSNNKLVLAGETGVISAGLVVLNKTFTNGIELAVNQTAGSSAPYYVDAGIGSGEPATLYGSNWWHTDFSGGGGSFEIQNYIQQMLWVGTETHYPGSTPATSYFANPIDYTNPTSAHTLVYGYDSSGNAYADILNKVGNYQGINVPDPYGYGQFDHPSVIYNENGIFGHKYWMLNTPYSGESKLRENPCLYYSDDGIEWFIPPNVVNPIDLTPSPNYNSDPELVFANNRLFCYYREYTQDGSTDYIRLRTYDGSAVSDQIDVSGPAGLSPSVLYDNGTFYMWIVNNHVSTPYTLQRWISNDGINWSNSTNMSISLSGKTVWHLDTLKRSNDPKIYGLLTFADLSGSNVNSGSTGVWFASADNALDNFSIQSTPLMKIGATQDLGITGQFYKATGTFISQSNSDGMRIWFSAWNPNAAHIGPVNYEGGWITKYTQVTPNGNGLWAIKSYSIPRAHLLRYTDTSYLNGQKQWMLSQGEYTTNHGGNRTISLVYGYKTGYDPSIQVNKYSNYTRVSITPPDSTNIQDYQVKIPGSLLEISTPDDSLDIESGTQQPVPPMANFSANPTSGTAPLNVQFTDLSEHATSYYWNFGDGANSTLKNPVHTYSTNGTYTVNLTVSNSYGTSSKIATINVSRPVPVPPMANFSANPTSGNVPLTVLFTDLSQNATSYNWNFGDGANSTLQNPVHTYSTNGTYTVNLTAMNSYGSSSKIATINVLPPNNGGNNQALKYWIDPNKNLWLNLSMNGSTQYFNIYNRPGYSPDGNAVMWAYDNFSSGSLDTNKWTPYKVGSNNAIVTVSNNKLVLAGETGVISAGLVVLNKTFTNGIELAVNQTAGSSAPYYVDAGIGSGEPATLYGSNWWHTDFSGGGGSFEIQNYIQQMLWVGTETHYPGSTPATSYFANPIDYTNPTSAHTLVYGYDSSGNAYADILNKVGNYQGINVPDPYGYGQFDHPSVIYNENGIFGHKYWMLNTPYSGESKLRENPCLYYSDDGIEWFIPPNVVNPIDLTPSPNYNSDPELVFANNRLFCYYREYTQDGSTDYIRLRTYDGSAVSDQIDVSGPAGLSPSVLYDNGTFYMWIVNNHVSTPYTLQRWISNDGINWSNSTNMSISLSGKTVWHLDTLKRSNDPKIYGLLTFADLSGSNVNSGSTGVWFASADNALDNFSIQSTPLMKIGATQDLGITGQFYKATGTFISQSNSDGMRIWFSAWNPNAAHIGPVNYEGGWITKYTQVTPNGNGLWAIKSYSIPRAHLLRYTDTSYLNGQKQWMLSQGEYTTNHGGNRTISLVYGYKTGYDPSIQVNKYSNYTRVSITPPDSTNIQDYQVKIPGSLLEISTPSDSLDIESVI
jgi:PKD repeat protein